MQSGLQKLDISHIPGKVIPEEVLLEETILLEDLPEDVIPRGLPG